MKILFYNFPRIFPIIDINFKKKKIDRGNAKIAKKKCGPQN